MIFPTSSIQGFLDIMKDLESINEKISKQYYILYGESGGEDSHIGFSTAQIEVNNAYDAVANLLSEVLKLKE